MNAHLTMGALDMPIAYMLDNKQGQNSISCHSALNIILKTNVKT